MFFFRRQIMLDPFALQMWRQPTPSSRAAFFLVLTAAGGRARRQIVSVLFWLYHAFRLGEMGPAAKEAAPALLMALKDEDEGVRSAAAKAIRTIDPAAAKKAEVLGVMPAAAAPQA